MMQGILAIDCWEQQSLQQFYAGLEKHIDFEQVQSIVVANYEVKLDTLDKSLYNTLETYCWETESSDTLLNIIRESRTRMHSTWLESKFADHTFMLLDFFSLQKHLETCVPHVQDWLVIGGSWQMCTHNRPINFGLLRQLKQNFYIAPWSIYSDTSADHSITDKDIQGDSLNWQANGNLYKLS